MYSMHCRFSRTLYIYINTLGPPDLCLCTEMAAKDISSIFWLIYYIVRTSTLQNKLQCP
jgi:hypothetical protein